MWRREGVRSTLASHPRVKRETTRSQLENGSIKLKQHRWKNPITELVN